MESRKLGKILQSSPLARGNCMYVVIMYMESHVFSMLAIKAINGRTATNTYTK